MTGFEATQKKKDDTIYAQRVKIEQTQKEVIELKWKIKEKDAALSGMKASNEKLSHEIAELKDANIEKAAKIIDLIETCRLLREGDKHIAI